MTLPLTSVNTDLRLAPTIYFVQSDSPDGPVKIGYTGRRVKKRLSEGQTFVSQELVLLAETYGTREDEARLHLLLRPYRIRGEWYRYEDIIKELVAFLTFDDGSLQLWLEGHGV